MLTPHTATNTESHRLNSMWVWLCCVLVFVALSGVSRSAVSASDPSILLSEQPGVVIGQRDAALFARELLSGVHSQQSAGGNDTGILPGTGSKLSSNWYISGIVSSLWQQTPRFANAAFSLPLTRAPPIL